MTSSERLLLDVRGLTVRFPTSDGVVQAVSDVSFKLSRGETLGVYVPTRRKQPKAADLSELKAAADRLAEALADVDEEEFVANFKQLRRRGKAKQLK